MESKIRSASVNDSNYPMMTIHQPSISEISDSQAGEGLSNLERKFSWQVAPNLWSSFSYAWAGLRYCFITQRNFRLHTLVGVLAIGLGFFLRVSNVEVAIISLTIALVLVLELINTALESVVDLTVKQTYHELAKIAKDCAAGAVLISAIASLGVAVLILLPPLVEQISNNL